MNERIKELALEADIHFSAHHQHSGVDTAVVVLSDLEKFAELIVKECADIATNRYQRLMDGGKAIKQHFGVE